MMAAQRRNPDETSNLCDGDGPVYRFRKYFEQFYVGYKMDAANIKF